MLDKYNGIRLLLHNPVKGAELPAGRKKREAKALSLKDDENLLARLVRPCHTINGRMDMNNMKSQTIRLRKSKNPETLQLQGFLWLRAERLIQNRAYCKLLQTYCNS